MIVGTENYLLYPYKSKLAKKSFIKKLAREFRQPSTANIKKKNLPFGKFLFFRLLLPFAL